MCKRSLQPIAWFTFLTVLAAILGYYYLFTGFGEWDDEGSLMMSVQQYMQGHKLYTEVPTGYGPIYYFYNWAIRALGVPLTHDAVRFAAFLPLLVVPLICAWYILQVTQSLAIASIVHIVTVFLTQDLIFEEAGHPQELCILLLVCFLAAGQLASNERWHSVSTFLLGVIAAALVFVKINIGVFVILGGTLAFLFHLPPFRIKRLAIPAAAMAAITVPFVLMNNHLDDSGIQTLSVVVSASVLALLLPLSASRRIESISFRDCWLAVAGFMMVFSGVLLCLKMRGIALFAVFDSIVLGNLRLFAGSRVFYSPPMMPRYWMLWAMAGIIASVLLTRFQRNPARSEEHVSLVVSGFKFFFGAAAVGLSLVGSGNAAALGFILPFSWFAIGPPSRKAARRQDFSITLLCTIGILQTLYVYPLAGSQLKFAKIPLVLIAALCAGDLMRSLPLTSRLWRKNVSWVTAAVLVCVTLSYAALIHRSQNGYDSLPSLGLRGANRIHVRERQARQYQWLVSNIQRYCDVIFGLPNIPSLHFWTAKDPVTTLIWNGWILSATTEQQRTIQAALSEHPDACIVSSPELMAFWSGNGELDVGTLPLVRYIHTEFRTALEMDQFRLLVRNGRRLNANERGG